MRIHDIVLAAALVIPAAGSAATIDFNTDAGGVPYVGLGDTFPAAEYAGMGVTINDSDPGLGITNVNLINPLNVGTDISGYYVNVGAFTDVATHLDLVFSTPVTEVGFDFATPSGALMVFAFGSGGGIVASNLLTGATPFVNQAGFNVLAGHGSLSGLGEIVRVLLVTAPNEALIADNLSFQAVPLPAALPLLGAGIFAMLGAANMRRRKFS